MLLDVVIDDKGQVGSADVVKSTADDFVAPTLAAVKKWRFKPAKIAGENVWVRLRLPVKFSPAS
ncbi:MAG: TonB family protein [Candidatus Synoicihabitans palmerolidicus]|nr:TonB family protein [Candidatus Synoicihabitans palmerolidicus]